MTLASDGHPTGIAYALAVDPQTNDGLPTEGGVPLS